mgnify:CR=1 FL=1
MKKNWFRLLALTVALLLCLTACGDKAGESAQSGDTSKSVEGAATVAQETGYGYLSEYSDLEDVKINYIEYAAAYDGTLYLMGDWYDEETFEGGTRLLARDLATGTVEEIPLPELQQTEGTNEYIQQISVNRDGSGYWVVVYRSTWNSDPAESLPEPIDETQAVGSAYSLTLLSESAPAEMAPTENPAETTEEFSDEDLAEEVPPEEDFVYDMDLRDFTEEYFIRKCDMTGKVLQEIDLTDAANEGDYFYVSAMAQDGDGNLYLASDTRVLV